MLLWEEVVVEEKARAKERFFPIVMHSDSDPKTKDLNCESLQWAKVAWRTFSNLFPE